MAAFLDDLKTKFGDLLPTHDKLMQLVENEDVPAAILTSAKNKSTLFQAFKTIDKPKAQPPKKKVSPLA